jgi:hypothetical protein
MKKWIDFRWSDRKKEIEILRANNQRLEKENNILRKDLFKALMRLKAYEAGV